MGELSDSFVVGELDLLDVAIRVEHYAAIGVVAEDLSRGGVRLHHVATLGALVLFHFRF